jgi:hypothetical protein
MVLVTLLLTFFAASVIGVTLGEPSFLVYMGLLDPKTETLTKNANQLIGATSGVFQVGSYPSLHLIICV